MITKSQNNKTYIKKNGLDHIHIIVPDVVKETFDIATRRNKTDMSKAIRKFISKYNSSYINKYENLSDKNNL